jgi:DnaK suppressor protein
MGFHEGWRMTHLTDSQLDELRAELERQLKKLVKSMSLTDEALKTVTLDQTAVGRVSRIDSLQNQGIAQGLRERETVRLAQIQQALERLSEGTYGSCTACGGNIAFERLFVFPESAVCAACSH